MNKNEWLLDVVNIVHKNISFCMYAMAYIGKDFNDMYCDVFLNIYFGLWLCSDIYIYIHICMYIYMPSQLKALIKEHL